MKTSEENIAKVISTNKKALLLYDIVERLEAGIELVGSEVKSVRSGRVNISDAFAMVKRDELFIYNMHISPYEKAAVFKPNPRRTRRLLVHKKEIRKLSSKTSQKGYTIVPLRIYITRRGLVKLEIALVRGRKKFGRKAQLVEREKEREKQRELGEWLRGRG
ncbi:SsrA-binding protein SmpB [bacterium]|nr:SsrA-binding protein SmpB [bacterium]